MTVGDNSGKYGSRTPFIQFHKGSTKILVCSAINGNKNYCWSSNQELQLNVFSNIQIRQTWDTQERKYVFFVFINGKKECRIVNNSPAKFDNVKLYASSPWYHPAQAIIKNLVFTNLPNG